MKTSAIDMSLELRDGCIATAMAVIGNKWTALIIRALLKGSMGFCEIEKSVGNINPRTLSQRLDDLEEQGIISKKNFSNMPHKSVYSLTRKGEDLMPVLEQMAAWGTKYS